LKQYAKSRKGQKNVERVNALLEFIFWFPKCDAMHLLHVALKMVHMLKNESLGLANKMAIGYLLTC
jgi:hypothetical protein